MRLLIAFLAGAVFSSLVGMTPPVGRAAEVAPAESGQYRSGYRDGYRDGFRDAYRDGYQEGHKDGYKLGSSEPRK